MRLLTCFTAFALVGLLAAAPASSEDNAKIRVSRAYYIPQLVKYTAKHDIVKLIVPVNAINVIDCNPESSHLDVDMTFFFVEADVNPDGSRVDQGLYVFRDGEAKKILDNGRDAAVPHFEISEKAYFGAKEGLYIYNYENNTAERYGPITDSIISLEITASGDAIYVLTEDRELYKVTDDGETAEKVDNVVDATEIVLDWDNNLYFISGDKKPYVRTADGVKKIEGLPESTGNVIIFKPPFVVSEGALVLVDNDVYLMNPNGTSEFTRFGFKPDAIPTAAALEASVFQYYAIDKKIYEYNLFALSENGLIKELSDFLKSKEPEINAVASKKTALKRKFKPST